VLSVRSSFSDSSRDDLKIDLTPTFVVLLFRNATENCYSDGRINNTNVQATSGINLVGF